MDAEEFREFGRAAVDFLADYMENIRDRQVLPSVEPGYLQKLMPKEAPKQPEKWQDVLLDLERIIMPGVTHWCSPHFHAYFPSPTSYPSAVGELLAAGLNCTGISWLSSPACTELEVVMMDWLGRLLGLPEVFLNSSDGHGGGVIQGSASEATLVALLAARERTVKQLRPDMDIRSKLVAYTSDQANSSVEKAGLLGSMIMRLLPTDSKCRLRGVTLEQAIKADRDNGLIPCYVVATLGTTETCAFDNLEELGPICNREGLWLHVDAAYAGAAFICPEFRHLMAGVQFVDSFNFNPHKWLLVNVDCSAMWVKDSRLLVEAFAVDRIYLEQHKQTSKIPEYRHWQISLGRRFRSLKLWMVLRLYGVEGLQRHIRHQVQLAEEFAGLVRQDSRFQIVTEVSMGLVCFRLKGEDSLTVRLHEQLMDRKNIYVIMGCVQDMHVIRFVICSRLTESRDIHFAWYEIKGQADIVLQGASLTVKKPLISNENTHISNGHLPNGRN